MCSALPDAAGQFLRQQVAKSTTLSVGGESSHCATSLDVDFHDFSWRAVWSAATYVPAAEEDDRIRRVDVPWPNQGHVPELDNQELGPHLPRGLGGGRWKYEKHCSTKFLTPPNRLQPAETGKERVDRSRDLKFSSDFDLCGLYHLRSQFVVSASPHHLDVEVIPISGPKE